MQIIFVGDEIVAGIGDARATGWTGRLIASTTFESREGAVPGVLHYNLACPRESSVDMKDRWLAEAARRRTGNDPCLVVFACSVQDLRLGMTLARIRLNMAQAIDQALREGYQVLLVGPAALQDVDARALAALNESMREVANRRQVPYVDIYTPLVGHSQWNGDLAQTGGSYPLQAGYGLITYVVLHSGWQDLVNSLSAQV